MTLTTLIKYYLIKIIIEAAVRTFLIYIIMIIIPSIILYKPVYIDRFFFEILIICIVASALGKIYNFTNTYFLSLYLFLYKYCNKVWWRNT